MIRTNVVVAVRTSQAFILDSQAKIANVNCL